ncbi:MAG: hypothetical protein KA538_04220 [Azonexus sp.]|jgi:hypothetical protein|nr:hypothetical protein [Azonexus sp.]
MTLRSAFLAGLLALAGGSGASMVAAAESRPTADWVVTPSQPGDNLPPVGHSLFDELFAVSASGQGRIDLPFPFEALLAKLDARLVRDPANPGRPPTRRVLIPLGRSLQRTAAAPDYFAYPRVVVAMDAQPASTTVPYLKDRLYIGYQEKSAVLEVISYNEAAGRFEFQLVKDYRAGGRPQVFYANRTLCFACHQNGSPIFSRALWDETNANPQTAALLAGTGRRFYGIAPDRGVDIPYAIDNATERANGFALTQRLWREGCGGNDLPARRCRAGLFTAALRHALSGGQARHPDADFRATVTDRLISEARRRWPGGLAVGNPDLPNRNPLAATQVWPADPAARIAHSHVAARFDPLSPRPPLGTWRPDAPGAVDTLIAGLAEFVSATDRQRLETALARQSGITTSTHVSPCRIDATASRWSVHCAPAAGQSGPTLNATLAIRNGQPVEGVVNRLALPGGTALSNIELTRPAVAAGDWRFTPRLDGRLPRTSNGDALASLAFRRTAGHPEGGELSLDVREDFTAAAQALTALAESPANSPAGTSLFDPAAIPRTGLFSALLARLGSPAAAVQVTASLPPPRLEVPAAIPGSGADMPVDKSIQGFFPYCAACHQSAETFPPNFLSGSGPQVQARLRQCAPRLYVRLGMADLPADQRDKTPMPPESMLPAFATDSAGWKRSPARAALLAQVGDWLRAETGRPPRLDEMLAGGYEALRPCLPTP